MKLVDQRNELKERVLELESRIKDLHSYLMLPKFYQDQSSTPDALCNYVNIDDILSRISDL